VNEELEAAFSGDNVRIRLKGVTDEDVSPGYVLTSPQKPIKTTTQFQAQLAILESKSIICAGYSCVMHAHTAAEEVTLVVRFPRSFLLPSAPLGETLTSRNVLFRNSCTTSRLRRAESQRSPPSSQRPVRPSSFLSLFASSLLKRPFEGKFSHSFLLGCLFSFSVSGVFAGQQIIALIETTQTVCLEKFTDYPQLGRFTLRDEGKTIAIGKVTKVRLDLSSD
jgi:hypothetical protein